MPWFLFACLGMAGTIGLWLASIARPEFNIKNKIIIALLVAGIVANGGMGILVYLSLISPILVASYYIYECFKLYAYNKRLQSDAASPRA